MPASFLYPLADAYRTPSYGPEQGATQRAQRINGDIYSETGSMGSVTIRGRATIGVSGAIRSGQTGYNNGTGFFMESNNGTPRMSIGNSAGNRMTWDGTSLSVVGAGTFTSGSIANWTINNNNLAGGDATLHSSGYLNLGTGNNLVRADATDATYRLWVGNATAASAPFSVTKGGQLNATNINVTGGTVAGATVGSGIAGGNITAGSITGTQIAASTITADKISVSNLAAIKADLGTITAGTINASLITVTNLSFTHMQQAGTLSTNQTISTGGKIKFGSGGNDYIDDNIIHFEVSDTAPTAAVEWKKSGNTPYGYLAGQAGTNDGISQLVANGISSRQSVLSLAAGNTDATTTVGMQSFASGGTLGASYTLTAAGSHSWLVGPATVGMSIGSSGLLSLLGRSGAGTSLIDFANFQAYTTTTAGAIATPANGAGFIGIKLAGTLYKVMVYAA